MGDNHYINRVAGWQATGRPKGQESQMNATTIEFRNGQNCGSGYDVTGYVRGRESAAEILRLRDRRAIYVYLDGADDPEAACAAFANGADIPAESEEGAKELFELLTAGAE